MLRNFKLKRIEAEAMKELVDGAAVGELWGRVLKSFEQWKQEKGDRKPRVPIGLISSKPIPFKKATPWQCAGFGRWPTPFALARKLLHEEYRPFMEIMKQDGILKVLAMLIVVCGKDKDCESDLRWAQGLLRDHKSIEAGIRATLEKHRAAIIAQRTRSGGGQKRGEQQKRDKESKHRLIQQKEAELSPTTPKRKMNKLIAKATGLDTDYVRKARKEMNAKH